MKRLALAATLSTALAVAAASAEAVPPNATPTTAATGGTTRKAENGAWGVDLSSMDTRVKPGDDFFRYVNGKWVERTEIPADRVEAGGLATLQDKALEQMRAILVEAAADTGAAKGSDRRKMGDWYASFMDEAAIEAAGFTPIKPELDAIAAVGNRQQLADLFARNHGRLGLKPITVGIDFDRNRARTTIVNIETGALALGSRDLYLDPAYAPILEAQRAHITRLLKIAGFDNAEERARNMQALETKIAKITWSATELRDDVKKNNVVSAAELAKRAPGIDWGRYLAGAGVGAPPVVNMSTPSSIVGMAQLIATEPLEAWKDYMRYMAVAGTSQYLPKAARDEVFAFYGKQLGGQQEPKQRWIEAVLDAGGQERPLSDMMSKAYIERYVSPDAKPAAKAMVDNLVAAFDARLAQLEWMAPETRAGARDKLSKVSIKLLYPEVWRDASTLDVRRGDPVGNARRGLALIRQENLSWLTRYPDHGIFLQPVFLVNAYANTTWNEIVFLAAIVQPPAFDPNADAAVNYGAMGAIIGHEVSHLFDDKGRASDGDGLLRDWWTPKDAERFTRVTKRLEQQVSSYEPISGKHVNGALTLGESIADLAGLVVAYDAYQRSLGGRAAPVLDGYTGDQRFFMAYAQAWRWKGREAAVEQLMRTDAHPPSAVRPNTVRNIDAWYQAFGVQPGDKLYLPPAERIRLW
ncbi:MAG: M13 family metallopeptidase [Candidatus Accumulibacter necessarius]|uniref:M13 family metallopeptidase n=1 Tax=Candidatus Accumulibacter necessarius TaxID=2954386 RepID=UPI002FC2BDC5